MPERERDEDIEIKCIKSISLTYVYVCIYIYIYAYNHIVGWLQQLWDISDHKHPQSVQNRLQKATTKFTTQNEQMHSKQTQKHQGKTRCLGPTFLCFLVLGMWCTWFWFHSFKQEAWTEMEWAEKPVGSKNTQNGGPDHAPVCSVYLTYYDLSSHYKSLLLSSFVVTDPSCAHLLR